MGPWAQAAEVLGLSGPRSPHQQRAPRRSGQESHAPLESRSVLTDGSSSPRPRLSCSSPCFLLLRRALPSEGNVRPRGTGVPMRRSRSHSACPWLYKQLLSGGADVAGTRSDPFALRPQRGPRPHLPAPAVPRARPCLAQPICPPTPRPSALGGDDPEAYVRCQLPVWRRGRAPGTRRAELPGDTLSLASPGPWQCSLELPPKYTACS